MPKGLSQGNGMKVCNQMIRDVITCLEGAKGVQNGSTLDF